MAEKMNSGLTGEMGKKWLKTRKNWGQKWDFGAIVLIFSAVFPPFSWWGQNPSFAILLPFRAGEGLVHAEDIRTWGFVFVLLYLA